MHPPTHASVPPIGPPCIHSLKNKPSLGPACAVPHRHTQAGSPPACGCDPDPASASDGLGQLTPPLPL
eukprot:165218-Chlamydomonas_euryale.AAC.1